jgi:preprotein translocase subunit SecA
LRKKLLLRGLCFAIVDEADSVLIDEARTPLILAGSGANDTENAHLYRDALGFASGLERGRDFELDQRGGVALTPRGVDRLEARATGCDGIWSGPRRRAEWVTRALVALHVFETDRHYLVRDGRVEIIDASTGRSASDRSWSEGLHQLIQVKECCPVTAPAEPLARVSYQHLFRRYLRLAGMTGTAREVSRELRATYRLDTVPIPRHEPCRVRVQPSRIFASDEERWRAVVARTAELHASGRPVLVGTCSVASSESLSQQLDAAGVPHDVLNARDDVNEANTVARAGEPGRVTVSTRMAGRGTDIPLADGVSELGGLHVIATEKAEARRIDRQLRGRCGRQGDPGSYEELHSLDGGPLSRLVAPMLRRICTSLLRLSFHRTVLALTYLAQRAEEMGYAQERRVLEWQEEKLEELLSFSGSRR